MFREEVNMYTHTHAHTHTRTHTYTEILVFDTLYAAHDSLRFHLSHESQRGHMTILVSHKSLAS